MELSKAHLQQEQNQIVEIKKGSIAEEIGIHVGDILLSVDGVEVHDIIEYKYLISEQEVELEILQDGEIIFFDIEKEYDEDIGLLFRNPLIDKANHCQNQCIFCFIDQLPPHMRETLYFKDDDSRLSFLQGNFITLTNLKKDEIDRIVRYRISPINISVHTTNPDLRIKMLRNKKAGMLLDVMKQFWEAGIKMNAQIVSIPGINDGAELERTFYDLMTLFPHLESVAIVPVGLTKFREKLEVLQSYDKEMAKKLLVQIRHLQEIALEKIETRFIYPSDEFYILSEEPIPKEEEYEGYPQIENGVGLVRLFEEELKKEVDQIEIICHAHEEIHLVTGKLAYDFMIKMTRLVQQKCPQKKIDIHMIENLFFGESITVTGLVTGEDIYQKLKDQNCKGRLLIPKCMLKYDEMIFLDDMTIDELSKKLNLQIQVIDVNGHSFAKAILSEKK